MVSGRRDELVEFDPDLDVWDQQPGEPDEHFMVFQAYLLRMPRPRRARDMVSKGRWGVEGVEGVDLDAEVSWSQKHVIRMERVWRWKDRANAWDAAQFEADAERMSGELRSLAALQVRFLVEATGKLEAAVASRDLSGESLRSLSEFAKVLIVGNAQVLGMRGGVAASGGMGLLEGDVLSAHGIDADEAFRAAVSELERRGELSSAGEVEGVAIESGGSEDVGESGDGSESGV